MMDLTCVVLTVRDDEGVLWTTAGYLGELESPGGVTIPWAAMKEYNPKVIEIKIVET